jgi:hypothetical protein
MTDTERIRALCQTFIDEAQHQIDEVGEAGAHEAVARAKVCRQILAEIALLPAVTSPDRIPPAVRKELEDYASVGAKPSLVVRRILEGDLFGPFWATTSDDEVLTVLPAVVAYIREWLHPVCYGSPEAVSRWIGRPRG